MFPLSLSRCVGGPDFPRVQRFRRKFAEQSPFLSLAEFTALMATRCEFQIRGNIDFNPSVQTLDFL